MKRIVEKEIRVCDFCEREAWHECSGGCGRHICYDCMGEDGFIEYETHVQNDFGRYCPDCSGREDDPLLELYKNRECLRVELGELTYSYGKQIEVIDRAIRDKLARTDT